MLRARRNIGRLDSSSLKSGLVHLWEFDGDANDKIGETNLTPTGVSGTISYATGKMKNCIFLNGGYFSNNAKTISLTDWTFAFWIRIINGGNQGISGIIGKSTGTEYQGIRYVKTADNQYKIALNTDSSNSNSAIFTGNVWRHICINKNANKTLFVDGQKVAFDNDMNYNITINAPIYVGVDNYAFNRYAVCYLEQLAIWNRVLSDIEVAKLYNEGNGLIFE